MNRLGHKTEADVLAELAAGRKPTLTKDRIRTRRRRSDAHLTRSQVFAAHKLYWDGSLTYTRIAELVGVEAESIRKAFVLHGLRIRSRSDAALLRESGRGCRGCGGPLDERAKGCQRCASRHWHRRRKVVSTVPVSGGSGAEPCDDSEDTNREVAA